MNPRAKEYFASLQRKPAVVAGHVAGVTIDPNTGQQTHAQIAIGNNLLRISLDLFAPPLANGDAVRLEQYGLAASADYRLAGLEAGGRANVGLFPILNDGTVIGGVAYPGGDYIFGKLDEGNLHIEAQTGRLYQRVGADTHGILYPDGRQLFGHCAKVGGEWTPDGANLLLSADAVKLRAGTTDTIRLTADGVAWLERKMHVSRNGTLQVGDNFGAQIRMGRVVEFDANGNPIAEEIDRYAIRAFDGSGLPRIAILTGTPDAPLSPAWFLGLENDLHYLRYQSGELDLKGRITTQEGRVGGFILAYDRLRSVNGRIQLVSEASDDFAEGMVLFADLPERTGAIRWIDPNNQVWNLGIEYTGYDPAYGGYVKYSHVSTPEGETGPTKHVWVSGGYGSQNKRLEFHSDGTLMGAEVVQTNHVEATRIVDQFGGVNAQLTLRGLVWTVFVPPTALPIVTNNGSVVSVTNFEDYNDGVYARLLYSAANGAFIPIPLDVRPRAGRAASVFAIGLKVFWHKATTNAYLATIKLAGQVFGGSKTTHKTVTNAQQGSAAGYYTTAVLTEEVDTPIQLAAGSTNQYFLVLQAYGMAASGDVKIMGVEMTLCDATYKELNQL